MDVTAWLLRHTPGRPLVLTAPGGTATRLAVERLVRERGWQPAMSPAEANLLVVAGADERFEPYVRQIWHTVPAPRVRVNIPTPAEAAPELDNALHLLHDVTHQRTEADVHTEHHDDAEHAGHMSGHEHHLSGMAMPGGIPMADRAADRDGLMLDQLHVPLGPALSLWPAGLIVHTRLQGDVVQEATVEVLTSGHEPFWPEHPPRARRLDSAARLLALTGWRDAATTAGRLRDSVLDGTTDQAAVGRRVRRSRALRWLLSGVGVVVDGPEQFLGDALDRLYHMIDKPSHDTADDTQWTVDALPALLNGTEFATARLVVASLDPDLDLLAADEVRHG